MILRWPRKRLIVLASNLMSRHIQCAIASLLTACKQYSPALYALKGHNSSSYVPVWWMSIQALRGPGSLMSIWIRSVVSSIFAIPIWWISDLRWNACTITLMKGSSDVSTRYMQHIHLQVENAMLTRVEPVKCSTGQRKMCLVRLISYSLAQEPDN